MDKPYKGSGKTWEMPTKDDNYHRTLQDKPWRNTLKPLNIDQPEGPSFQVTYSLLHKEDFPEEAMQSVPDLFRTSCKFGVSIFVANSPSQGGLADAQAFS